MTRFVSPALIAAALALAALALPVQAQEGAPIMDIMRKADQKTTAMEQRR